MTFETEVRVVVYQEGTQWLAQCVDLDIATQADTMNYALRRFDMAFTANMAHCEELDADPVAEIGLAPQKFDDIWNAGEVTITPKVPLHAQVSVVLSEAA